jgi:transcriptional regulator NrdR family protein
MIPESLDLLEPFCPYCSSVDCTWRYYDDGKIEKGLVIVDWSCNHCTGRYTTEHSRKELSL